MQFIKTSAVLLDFAPLPSSGVSWLWEANKRERRCGGTGAGVKVGEPHTLQVTHTRNMTNMQVVLLSYILL